MTRQDLIDAGVEGALLTVRPKGDDGRRHHRGLLPIMLRGGTGSEVMRRIAAPMVGGMGTAAILMLIVIPAVYLLWKQDGLKRSAHQVAIAPMPADTTL